MATLWVCGTGENIPPRTRRDDECPGLGKREGTSHPVVQDVRRCVIAVVGRRLVAYPERGGGTGMEALCAVLGWTARDSDVSAATRT